VKFNAGSGWSNEDAARRRRVVVISQAIAQRLYGGAPALGRSLLIDDHDFRVIGVVGDWTPRPLFYESSGLAAWGRTDDFFVPIETAIELAMKPAGGMVCWGQGRLDGDACGWLQYWIRLSDGQRSGYERFLRDYAAEEKLHGRSLTVLGTGLLDLQSRMEAMELIPREVRLEAMLAWGFLGICILNASGLLLARFLAKSPELAVRRALGACRKHIFAQLMQEGALMGLLALLVGGCVCVLGVALLRGRPAPYAELAAIDGRTVVILMMLSIAACLVAAVIPAWRASRIEPAWFIKEC
jgi:putative ABC transport system permease protein